MMSFEARAYSVRKITSNEGKFTPGIDGIVISTPQDKLKAIQKLRYVMLNPKKYKPGLIKRV
jgi:RNA-directed DNA polymerase